MKDVDYSELKINIAKFRADGDRYFGLFDKHIPTGLRANAKILIYKIGNLTTIAKIIEKNPAVVYYICDRKCVCEGICIVCPKANVKSLPTDSQEKYDMFKDKEMKFDLIIMNPPYDRNLHLKILAEAIAHLKDEKSRCVNLSPILWIQDPHAHMKPKSNLFKFKCSIVDKCLEIETVDMTKCNSLFGIGLYVNLGVYVCVNYNINEVQVEEFWKRSFKDWEINLFNRIYGMPVHLSDVCEKDRRDGIRVLIAFIAGNRGALPVYKDLAYVIDGYKAGKDWTRCKNLGNYEKPEGVLIPFSIKFNTETEAQNFYDSWKTPVLKWLAGRYLFDQHIQLQFLPFLGNVVNPRTGIVSYIGEWTNEDICSYFKLTEDEKYQIEKTAANYVRLRK